MIKKKKKSREAYSAIKKLTKKSSSRIQSVKSKDGNILTEEEDVKNRWMESYQELYNTENPFSIDILNTIPKCTNSEEEPPILREEVAKAVEHFKDGKAPGYDSITAEELKAAGGPGIDALYHLSTRIWDTETIPADWGKAVITPIYKKKDKLDCNNYRGISLLSHPGKILTYIIQQRIRDKTESILSEAQAGFRPGRGTADQLFALRQIMESYIEKGKNLFVCYIDFEKAFDRVWQTGLWHCMAFFGFPDKYIRLLQALYNQSQSAVRVNGSLTDWFSTRVGVRQGCIISPQLFNILLEVAMLHALHDLDLGACMNGTIINNLRFADDIAILAESEEDLQTLVSEVFKTSSQLGLKISLTKTQVQVIGRGCDKINIHLANHTLEQVKSFIYLGGQIDEDGTCQNDVKRRIGLALGAMHALHPIWRAKDISNQTKIALYRSLVLSIVLYAAETWTLRKRDQDRLLSFEMSCLRRILGISRRDRIRNDHIRQKLDLETTIMDRIHSRRLTYYGHVIRMCNNRLPLITLSGSTRGTRPKGRPPKRWIDCCKESCMTRGIASLTDARWLIQDRQKWRTFSSSSHLDRA